MAVRVVLVGVCAAGAAAADPATSQPASAPAHAAPASAPASQLTYSGDWLERSTLTGDWGGLRNELADKGITFDASLTQVFQGVVAGGRTPGADYGGRFDATLMLDFQKLGLWPGAFALVELEGKYGNFTNPRSGALLPVDVNALWPVPLVDEWAIPQAAFAQYVSPQLGFLVGKLQTLSGDMNEFAHGKGDKGFLNMAFNLNPVLAMVPYSTLGASMIYMPTKEIQYTVAVLGPAGEANQCNFDNVFKNGVFVLSELRVTTDFFGLTGHQLVGGGYSTREYTSLDQSGELLPVPALARPLLPQVRGLNLLRAAALLASSPIQAADGTWNIYYNFDQYIYEPEKGSGKGIGLFGRVGVSDGVANPVHLFFSGGIGGKGVVPHRPLDEFGLGYYYMVASNASVPSLLGLGDEQGLELFYQIGLTKWLSVTPDFQVVQPSPQRQDTAYILGLRVQMTF